MKHTSELRWGDVGIDVSSQSQTIKQALIQGEDVYQEMLELYQYAGGTAQGLADQLFVDVWSVRESDPIGAPGVFDTQANTTEVSMAQDAIDAMAAIHQLYEAATNVVVAQSDRLAALRRMS